MCSTAAGHGSARPAYPGIGFSPDGGMSWTLPGAWRRPGRYILLTNQVLDAGQALALGRIKHLLRGGASAEFGAHLDAEADQIAASAAGDEGREGVRAFIERRRRASTASRPSARHQADRSRRGAPRIRGGATEIMKEVAGRDLGLCGGATPAREGRTWTARCW